MVQQLDQMNVSVAQVRGFLARVAEAFATTPFEPHQVFTGGHAQTLAAFAWPRRRKFKTVGDQERIFQTAPDVKVLAHCRWAYRHCCG